MYSVGQINSPYFCSTSSPLYVLCGADTLPPISTLPLYAFCGADTLPPISTLPLYALHGADTLPLFLLYPYMYSVAETNGALSAM
jgi:hypothetical protein